MSSTSPARQASSLYQARFSSDPSSGASAPGRVNLIGEHVDYNGGPVLPLGITVRTAAMTGLADAGHWEVCSTLHGDPVTLDPAVMRGDWTDYVTGVIRVLVADGAAPPGARIAIASAVPIGAGLSSSAALCVSVTRALSVLARRRLAAAAIADVAYRAEHDEVGMKCGRMDQTAVTFARPGRALLFETATGEIRLVPMAARIWIMETGVSHRLVGGDYNVRRGECDHGLALLQEHGYKIDSLAALPPKDLDAALRILPPPVDRRVRHVVTETARTRAAAAALERQDMVEFGRLLVAAHGSMRDDYQASCPEADFLVASAMRQGAWGARITGAGWGGAVILLAPPERERRIVAAVQEDFRSAFGRAPKIWSTRASSGVRGETVGKEGRGKREEGEGGAGSGRREGGRGDREEGRGEVTVTRLIDVSHTVEHGMVTYKGSRPPSSATT